MEYRLLGASGIRVSNLSLGAMTFGGEATVSDAKDMYQMALDHGINHFDTANFYANGRSEEILGQLTKGHRQDVVLATKAYFPTGRGPNDRGLSRIHLRKTLDDSLRRLKTDYIDIFYLHHFDQNTPLNETLRTIDDFVRAGKILYLGLSNFTAWQTMKAQEVSKVHGYIAPTVIQPMYNLVKRQVEVEIFPMAKSEGLGVISYSPLGGGLLTGKYQEDPKADGRLNQIKAYQVRYDLDYIPQVMANLDSHCQQSKASLPAMSIAWARDHPQVSSVLLGARNSDQLKQALAADDFKLTGEERSALTALTYELPSPLDRNDEKQDLISAHALAQDKTKPAARKKSAEKNP